MPMKQRGPVRGMNATSPESEASRPGRAKRKPTFGQHDHQDPWYDGEQWRDVSMAHSTSHDDELWFRANPERRLRIRRAFSYECRCGPTWTSLWVIVVRSRHDSFWNTVSFRFHDGMQFWPEPQSDDDALMIVGRYDLRAMLDAKLLTINYRHVGNAFLLFDYGACDE